MEISSQVKRFQQIKAREKVIAIEKAKMREANPTLSKQQVEELYRKAHEPKGIVIKTSQVSKQSIVVRKG